MEKITDTVQSWVSEGHQQARYIDKMQTCHGSSKHPQSTLQFGDKLVFLVELMFE